STNHPTHAPQTQPIFFARSAPESNRTSGTVMSTHGAKKATNPTTARTNRAPRPRLHSNHESGSRCGWTGMPKSSSARAACDGGSLDGAVSTSPQEGHSFASPLAKSSWQNGQATRSLTAEVG